MFRKRKRGANTLDLYGDGDDLEILEEIECTFDIKISDDEAQSMRTVGDLHDVVLEKCPPQPGTPCLSARAFREIAHQRPFAGRRVKPSSRLDEVAGDMALVPGLVEEVDRISGSDDWLSTPHWGVAAVGGLLFLAPLGGAVLFPEASGPFAAVWLLTIALIAPICTVASTHLPRSVPTHIRTVGDLAHWTLARDYRRLSKVGDTGTRSDLWWVVQGICRDRSESTRPINRDTTFFA